MNKLVPAPVCIHMHVCMCACCIRVCVCVCVRERERETCQLQVPRHETSEHQEFSSLQHHADKGEWMHAFPANGDGLLLLPVIVK
jgi:hypothetical protein